MVFNPATDFLGLWRNTAGNVSKLEMPGLDYVVAALARAGVINVSVSATAPVANQSTTAWLHAAVPSYSAEGALNLWDKVTSAYLPATPALFLQFLEASASQTGVSWYTTTGGPPLNTIGNNGDFAIRTDEPGGIFGPKALGAWPATPIPGTTDVIGSAQLDLTFGSAVGNLIIRGPATWQALPIGAVDNVLMSESGIPAWEPLSVMLDRFGSVQGDLLYRSATVWTVLPPGIAGQVLSTNGAGANPAWAAKTPEFSSGTVLVFQQTTAPTGWTKQVALNDYGLRVTSGVTGITAGSGFSTVFAQTTVGNTTLNATQIPSHTHGYTIASSSGFQKVGGTGTSPLDTLSASNTDGGTGGNGAHTHSVNLQLAYVDVIIASKN